MKANAGSFAQIQACGHSTEDTAASIPACHPAPPRPAPPRPAPPRPAPPRPAPPPTGRTHNDGHGGQAHVLQVAPVHGPGHVPDGSVLSHNQPACRQCMMMGALMHANTDESSSELAVSARRLGHRAAKHLAVVWGMIRASSVELKGACSCRRAAQPRPAGCV